MKRAKTKCGCKHARQRNPHGFEQQIVDGRGFRAVIWRDGDEALRLEHDHLRDTFTASHARKRDWYSFARLDVNDGRVSFARAVDAKRAGFRDVIILQQMFDALAASYAPRANPVPADHGEAVDAATNARIDRELADPRMTTTYGRRANPAKRPGEWESESVAELVSLIFRHGAELPLPASLALSEIEANGGTVLGNFVGATDSHDDAISLLVGAPRSLLVDDDGRRTGTLNALRAIGLYGPRNSWRDDRMEYSRTLIEVSWRRSNPVPPKRPQVHGARRATRGS